MVVRHGKRGPADDHPDALAWLLEELGDKFKIIDDTLEKEEVDEDVFKKEYVMQVGVWEAVKRFLSSGERAPVKENVESTRRAHKELT